MAWEQIVRWLGAGCILAGISRMGMTPASLIWGTDSTVELTFGFVACVLMATASLALYMVQSKETGITGFLTVLLIMTGNLLTACILWGKMHYGHYGDEDGPIIAITRIVGSVGVLGGSLVLGILSWRAKVFPRLVTVLLALMVVYTALPWGEWFAVFWGLPYVGMGYCIWRGKLNGEPYRKADASAIAQ